MGNMQSIDSKSFTHLETTRLLAALERRLRRTVRTADNWSERFLCKRFTFSVFARFGWSVRKVYRLTSLTSGTTYSRFARRMPQRMCQPTPGMASGWGGEVLTPPPKLTVRQLDRTAKLLAQAVRLRAPPTQDAVTTYAAARHR